MKKLSKEQRDRLMLAVMIGLAIIAGLWFGLIKTQKAGLKTLAEKTEKARQKVTDAKRRVERGAQIQAELEQATSKLRSIEDGMAPADKYAWLIQTVNEFRTKYKIDKLSFSREQVGEVKMLPGFPYKAATFRVQGVAHYHELGKFIADFENSFPYISLQNLQIERQPTEPASVTNIEELEKLAFKMDIETLVKPLAP
jgi:Tfp pilus assembly protein PilO